MYRKLTMPLLTLLLIGNIATSQTSQDEAIKTALNAETTAFYSKDTATFTSLWAHDPTSTVVVSFPGGTMSWTGWDSIRPVAISAILARTNPATFTNEDFVIRKDASLATADYKQTVKVKKDDSITTSVTQEHRVLIKSKGKWKIITMISRSLDPKTDQSVEASVNSSGYDLLGMGKTQDAIKLFKLNTELFPKAWNTYDSLGEAYLAAGDKENAKTNYQKSVDLNPKNDNGKKALEKL